MQRKFLLFGILVILVIFGYGVFYGVRFYNTRASLQAYNDYNNIFKNDTYGGATPEETLQLFIAALKEGDVDKATLYFMPDDTGSREKWKNFLLGKKSNLADFALILSSAKPAGSSYGGQYWFRSDESGQKFDIEFVDNGQVWKIESL